jgi:hypothetical protein
MLCCWVRHSGAAAAQQAALLQDHDTLFRATVSRDPAFLDAAGDLLVGLLQWYDRIQQQRLRQVLALDGPISSVAGSCVEAAYGSPKAVQSALRRFKNGQALLLPSFLDWRCCVFRRVCRRSFNTKRRTITKRQSHGSSSSSSSSSGIQRGCRCRRQGQLWLVGKCGLISTG